MDSGLSIRKDPSHSCPSPSLPEPKKESRLTSIIDRISIRAGSQQPFYPGTPHGPSEHQTEPFGRPCSRNSSSTNSDAESSLDETQARIGGGRSTSAPPATPTITSSRSNSSSSSDPGGRTKRRRNHHKEEGTPSASPAARPGPVTSKRAFAEGQTPVDRGLRCHAPRQSDMPTDTLSLDPVTVVKSERFSPEVESSSPSVSPHSPSPARAFPGLAVGGRTLSGPPGSAALPYSAAAAAGFSPAIHAGSAPALKQMEMMTRNYSDFMRSLAAKYNNQNAQESAQFGGGQTNGILRGSTLHDSPFKSSSPLQREPETRGKSSPPILLDQRLIPGSCYPNLADFSSSQTLLNLVRTASAQSATQLENYLRGASKRSIHDDTVPHASSRTDPLDLSSKRLRMDSSVAALDSLHGCRIPSPATAMRDLRDALLMQGLKLDPADLLNGPLAELNTALRIPKNKSEAKPSRTSTPAAASKAPSPLAVSHSQDSSVPLGPPPLPRCSSQCSEQSCSKPENSEVSRWNVDDVVQFVSSLECCAEYAEKFRDQSIDGASLSMLSEDHLTSFLGMKLGPALRLKAAVAKRIGHCSVCMHCVHCHKDPATSGTPTPGLNVSTGMDSLTAPSSSSSTDEPSRSPPTCK